MFSILLATRGEPRGRRKPRGAFRSAESFRGKPWKWGNRGESSVENEGNGDNGRFGVGSDGIAVGAEEKRGGSELQGSEREARGSENVWIVAEVDVFV